MPAPGSPATNTFGQPIGPPLPGWKPPPVPPRTPLQGRLCRLVPVEPASHAEPLFRQFAADAQGQMWTYL
ncbi:MAG: hypothetical protein EHM42_10175, partial [Planctomycetaceae bacterium]